MAAAVAQPSPVRRPLIVAVIIGVVAVALLWASNAEATTTVFGDTGDDPLAMTMDSAGTLYVTNSNSSSVSKITSAGVSTVLWKSVGSEPYGITIDASGNLYVANRVSSSVSKITPDGTVTTLGNTGSGTFPRAVAVNAAGTVYTANTDTNTVTKITADGTTTQNWATTGASPRAIAIDASGNIYTANTDANTVTKITPAGQTTAAWASTGGAPSAIAIDAAGNVYVTNYLDNTVSKITPAGASTVAWATTGGGPTGITIDASGIIYTTNLLAATVSKITPAGASTITWASTGTGSRPLAIVADTAGNVFTTNNGSDTVSKIAPDPAAAPTALVATAGETSVSVAFTPGSDNGWAITNYEYSLDGGSTWTMRSPASAASPIVITGLTTGAEYDIKLRAINIAGNSAASSVVRATTITVPSAPTGLAATVGDRSVSIAFAAGADNGAAITNYAYSLDDGATWTTRSPAAVTSPISITGLRNGTAYPIRLRAINSVGAGAASSAVSITPVAVPDAPTSLVATAFATDAKIRIAFTAGADNGWPITNYAYSLDDGATWTARSPVSATSPITIDELTNGTVYKIRLRAINRVGGGTPSTAVSIALPPAPLKAVALSATTLATDEPLIATFAAAPGTTYTISATPNTTRFAVRAAKTVRGKCSVTTNQKTKKRAATCRIRLKKAGAWRIAITPVRNGVKGTPAVKRVIVRTSLLR